MRKQVGVALLALGLAGPALAFGGQHTSVLLIAALAAAGAAALLPLSRTAPAVWLLALLSAFALVQLLPLPLGVVSWLSPTAADVWRRAFVPFGRGAPAWATLSVDPGGTALEALKWASYACVLSAALGLRARRGSEAVALLVGGTALLVCIVTLVHGIFDAERIYGFFRPIDPSRWVRGPFVNGNNLSGFLNLGVFAGAGFWISRREPIVRGVVGTGVLLMAAGSLLAGSRGGTACLLLGVLLFVFLTSRASGGAGRRGLLVVTAIACSGIAAAAIIGGSRIWETFEDTQVRAKLGTWRWTLGMIADYPIFGAGRGAFETAFQPYRRLLGNDWTVVFAHAESFPLEWCAEWGLPVALVVLFLLGLSLVRIARHARRSPVAAGLATGVAALLLQNFADLGLELYAVMALALTAFAGAAPPVTLTERPRPYSPAHAFVLLAFLVVLVVGASPVQVERRRQADAYGALARASRAELVSFRNALEPVVRRHPGESYFPLLGGLVARRLHENSLPWFARALERSPLDARVHLALADALLERGVRDQARLHTRLAAVYDVVLRDQALRRLADEAKTPRDIVEAFPELVPGETLLPRLCALVGATLRVACFREAVRRTPNVETNRGLATTLVDSLEHASPPCDGEGAKTCAAEAGRALASLGPAAFAQHWRTAIVQARLYAWQGDPGRAAATLLEHCPATTEAAECCAEALELASLARDVEPLTVTATRYEAVMCGEPVACAGAHERIGRTYQKHGDRALALRHFMEAAKLNPAADRWLLAAEAAADAGSNVAAKLALDRANKEDLHDPAQRARVDAIRERLMSTPFD